MRPALLPGLVAIGVLLLAALPEVVSAHAILLRVEPPTGRTVASPPGEVRLLFSEPIDPEFSHVQVLDARGNPVDLGNSHVDDTLLIASLQPNLANGVYTVDWRSLSSVDVHPESGQYALFIGVPPTTTAALSQRSESTPPTILARWTGTAPPAALSRGFATKIWIGRSSITLSAWRAGIETVSR